MPHPCEYFKDGKALSLEEIRQYAQSFRAAEVRKFLPEIEKQSYQAISWDKGEAQADRYDLSKHIDAIRYYSHTDGTYTVLPIKNGKAIDIGAKTQNITPDEVADLVGKDVADKIMAGTGEPRDEYMQQMRERGQPIEAFQFEKTPEPTPITKLPEGYEVSFDRTRPEGEQYSIIPPGQAHGRPFEGNHASPESAKAWAVYRLNENQKSEWQNGNYSAGKWGIRYQSGKTMGTWLSKKDAEWDMESQKKMLAEPPQRELSGVDLKVGGEGMKGFYDKILPAFANKYAKKWGSQVSTGTINAGRGRSQQRVLDTILREDFGTDWGSATPEQQNAAMEIQHGETKGLDQEETRKMRALLKEEGNLGFDSTSQALHAIAGHSDWGTRWDVPPGELRTLLTMWRAAGTKLAKVHSLPITEAMRESVMQGQPLFAKSIDASKPGQPAMEYRPRTGILWVNGPAMEQISKLANTPAARGMYLPAAHFEGLREMAKGSQAISQALEEAAEHDDTLVIVRRDKGESIAQAKATARHELFHQTEKWAYNGARGTMLLKDPLAKRAAESLKRYGYDSASPALMWSEIGANLVSGQEGWDAIGLTEPEAKQLFQKYSRMLVPGELDKLTRITPKLKQELYAARAVARSAQEQLGRGENGPVDTSEEGPDGGQLRRGVGQDLSSEPGRLSRDERESGKRSGIDSIEDHLTRLIEELGENEPEVGNILRDTPAPQPKAEPTTTAQPGTKPSKLSEGVEAKAITNKLTEGFEGRPEYKTVNIVEQSKLAADLVKNDRDRAIRIAMGSEVPPNGLLPESVFVAVENYATATKDVDLLRELATKSTRSMEATGMGQRIRMLGERNPDSPVAAMQKVVEAREAASAKKYGPKAVDKIKKQIKVSMKLTQPRPKDWTAWVESIKCPE